MKVPDHKRYIFLIGLIIAVSSTAVFTEVMEPDGALYAVIAKNIILKNDWLNLYVNGTDWLDKPHLTFWLTALSFKLFGISAFAYKLPAFLAVLLAAWYLYRFAKGIYNQKTALVSVIIFLTALHLVISVFDVRAEGYLTAFIIAAIYHYYKAHNGSFWHIVAGSLFTACAIMVKGIFVIVPILSGFVVYRIVTKQYKELIKPRWWIAFLLILIFIIPEMYALYIQFDLHPEKIVFGETNVSGLKFFFWDSQFGRFLNNGPIKGKGDVSFFLHTNIWAFLPWSLLFYTAVANLISKKNREVQPAESVIVWSGALVAFLMFSLSRFQLPHYVIVLFPQFALITAIYLISLKEKPLKIFFMIQNSIFFVVVALLCTLAVVFRFQHGYLSIALLLTVLLIAFIVFKGRSIPTIISRNTMLSLGIMLFLYLFFYPSLLEYQSGMQAGKWMKENHPAAMAKVLTDPNAFSFDFYADGEVIHFYNYTDLEHAKGKKNMIIYMSGTVLSELKNVHSLQILKEFEYYRITRLKGKFLNYKTRPSTLEKYYLVQMR